jgi:signal transduction histidine kinase
MIKPVGYPTKRLFVVDRVLSLPKIPYWRPIIIILATLAYGIIFMAAHAAMGSVVAALVAFPVMLVGGLYGLRAGISAGFFSYFLNTLLFNVVGISGWDAVVIVGGSPGQFVVIVVGAVFGWTHDIQLAREKLLQQTQNLNSELNALLSIIPDVLFRLDANGIIMDYRAGEDAALQWDTPIIGQRYTEILPPELVMEIQAHDHSQRTTTTIHLNTNQQQRWYEMLIVPIAAKQLIVLLRDLTQQKRNEQQRLELVAQQSRITYLQEFISNLSHDLRTPLTVIKTSLYLLERFDDPSRQPEKLEQIKLQTRHLEKFIEDVLMITRLDSSFEESLMFVPINRVVQHAVDAHAEQAQTKGLRLTCDLPQNSLMILAHELSIQRVLNIILANAVTYTNNGSIAILTSVKNSHVVIEIRDTGIGIREDEQARIFESFFRADKARSIDTGGAGLGLSIARRIIEIHHGQIHIASVVGTGTTVTIELPLFQARSNEYVTNVGNEPTEPARQAETQ